MIPKKTPLLWSDDQTNALLHLALQQDQVALTTTDTIPGLLARLTEKSFALLNRLKGGRQSKPYLILIADRQKTAYFVDQQNMAPSVELLMRNCWPGPLTLVCKAREALPSHLKSIEGTVALRCPDHEGLLQLLIGFDGLFSTSANTSNAPAPASVRDVSDQLLKQVACVVGDEEDDREQSVQPSAILDVSSLTVDAHGQERGNIHLVRAGAVTVEQLEELLQKKIY